MPYILSMLDRVEAVDEIFDIEDTDEIFFDCMNLHFHELTSEAVNDAIKKTRSESQYCGDPTELESKSSEWFEESVNILQERIGSNFCVKVQKNDQLIAEHCKPVNEVLEYFQGDERWEINSGSLVLILVENFLRLGVWQAGFRRTSGEVLKLNDAEFYLLDTSGNWITDKNEKLEPIIWFGVKNDPPIQCWTIDKSEFQLQKRSFHSLNGVVQCDQWQAFWHSYFWVLDWETLIPFGMGSMTTWMFAECGMDEPENAFNAALESCPIDLGCQNSTELFELVDKFIKTHSK